MPKSKSNDAGGEPTILIISIKLVADNFEYICSFKCEST